MLLQDGTLAVVSGISREESNEVAREVAEKEVLVDVPADEVFVMEDEIDGLSSKEPKSVVGSHSKLLFCADSLR